MLVQPIEFKSEDINQQFKKVHKIDLIEDSKNFIEEDDKEKFVLFLKKPFKCTTTFYYKS